MNPQSLSPTPRLLLEPSERLHEIWLFLAGMGIALMILGAILMVSAFLTTVVTIVLLGIILLLGAVFQFVTAFWGRHWRGFFLHLMSGVLYFVLGVFMIDNPVEAAVGLTVLVAAGLLAGGGLRIALSLADRFPGWEWTLLSGVLSVLLGAAVWSQWPFSGLWVIGLFVGIEMVASGMSWLMLALAARTLVAKSPLS